jgi:surface protein
LVELDLQWGEMWCILWVSKTLDLRVLTCRQQGTKWRLTLCICIYYHCSATMNDWDVSGITNFAKMFYDLPTFNEHIVNWDVSSGTKFQFMFGRCSQFNQDITNWNVSSGLTFVSNDQGVRFESIRPFVWLCFQAGCRVKSKLSLSFQIVFSTFPHVREACLVLPGTLIKTSVNGTSHVEQAL